MSAGMTTRVEVPLASTAVWKRRQLTSSNPQKLRTNHEMPARFDPGHQFGQFSIQHPLGRGGMAEVYRALHPQMGEVALKISHLASETFMQDEARTLSRLASGNSKLVNLLDHGMVDGYRYLALEYIPGQTVKALLDDGPLTVPRALDIISQISYGLNNLHENGFIHRDVKPNNIMVGDDGKATLIDMGSAVPSPTEATGSVVGSLAYMSPEQVCGESMGPTSDIFSLGLTFHMMLTGKHPYKGDPLDMARQLRDEQLPMLPDTFHPEIRRIVGRMTAHDRANRYQNVMDIVRDIRLFTENQ